MAQIRITTVIAMVVALARLGHCLDVGSFLPFLSQEEELERSKRQAEAEEADAAADDQQQVEMVKWDLDSLIALHFNQTPDVAGEPRKFDFRKTSYRHFFFILPSSTTKVGK